MNEWCEKVKLRMDKDNGRERINLGLKLVRGSRSALLHSLSAHPPSIHPSSSCSFSSFSSSSLPCAQGCSMWKGKPYLPLTQPPWINAGHRCCTAQTHTHTHTNCRHGLKTPAFSRVNPCLSICLRLYLSVSPITILAFLSVSVCLQLTICEPDSALTFSSIHTDTSLSGYPLRLGVCLFHIVAYWLLI